LQAQEFMDENQGIVRRLIKGSNTSNLHACGSNGAGKQEESSLLLPCLNLFRQKKTDGAKVVSSSVVLDWSN
jgi:hypothetical protein